MVRIEVKSVKPSCMSIDQRFLFISTQDGSPTLRLIAAPANALKRTDQQDTGQHTEETSEAMHSLDGAFSETVYIYGAAIEKAIESRSQTESTASTRVLSLGLGLGYVELLSTALFLKHHVPLADCAGLSFEINPELRKQFSFWLANTPDLAPQFAAAYEQILDLTAKYSDLSPELIKQTLSSYLSTGKWQLAEALTTATLGQYQQYDHYQFETPFHCICFDAFSAKSSPELWSSEFLDGFLRVAAAPTCVFATYACTGNLKRSLSAAGFTVQVRPGFAKKRESTLAIRAVSN